MTAAFDPIDLGGRALANRVVMAPMTRNRAFGPGGAPTRDVVEYYAQRASAGLIISEATYDYDSPADYLMPGLTKFKHTYYLRPRVTDKTLCPNC